MRNPTVNLARLSRRSADFDTRKGRGDRFARRGFLAMLVLCAAAAPLWGADAKQKKADGKKRVFKAGAFAMDVSPPRFPISLNGGMSDNIAKGVHDPIHARCIVLDDGESQIVFVVTDSCMIPRHIFDNAKTIASKATGIPVERMLTSATHAHSAPTSTGVFQSDPDIPYTEFLTKKIAEAIIEAHKKKVPAQIGWGVGREPSQVFNRRWFMSERLPLKDPFGNSTDRVRMNPPPGSPELVKPSGPIDPEVAILAVRTADGKPLALLANYSLHYVGGVPGGMVSADYFGEFAVRIGQRLGVKPDDKSFVGIMSNGTSGNINNIDFSSKTRPARKPFEQIQIVAANIADVAFRTYEKVKFHDWVPLRMAEKEVELGVRLPSEQDLADAQKRLAEAGKGPYRAMPEIYARETVLLAKYPKTVRTRLQAIRIGELGIVSSPCETFVETGLAIKKQSPFKPTFVIELANGYNGYLPTPQHHEWGGYETWRARSSYLATDAEPIVRKTLLELLTQVSKK